MAFSYRIRYHMEYAESMETLYSNFDDIAEISFAGKTPFENSVVDIDALRSALAD